MTAIDLTGKTAFVTGSTRGIGLAIARALHGAGAKVAIVGRDLERARSVAAGARRPGRGVACDVAQADQVEAAVRRPKRRWARSTSWSTTPASPGTTSCCG